MRIGIDISQIVYGTGVSRYQRQLVEALLKIDHKNEYILFGSSLRLRRELDNFKKTLSKYSNAKFKFYPIPLILLEFIWNKLHILPIDKLIGYVDVFHSSDWIQPPISSEFTKKITTIHDMVVYLFPSSMHKKILQMQKYKYQNLQLVLSGKYGWGEELKVRENVIWTDFINQDDLIALYSGCRV